MKGCIYFFKHNESSPIKIGFTTNDSPIERFKQFSTYSPYGGSVIGFAQVENPNKIERELHLKYSNKRLKGEWFDISIDEVNKELDILRSKDEIEKRNIFELMFARHLGYVEKDNKLETAVLTLFSVPNSNDGIFLTATQIQSMIIDTTEYDCSSLKMLGIELKKIFGEPKFRERSYKYFVKIKEI